MKTLIFVPTYNENENVVPLYERIKALKLNADLLFMDDASPDGTGETLEKLKEKDPRLTVLHRSGKLGIGSAHRDGILWADQKGYETLLTMDADFSHSPEDIPKMLYLSRNSDIVVASRHINPGSLDGWNLFRKFLTTFGHALTRLLLGMNQDATGALRVYRLDRISIGFLSRVESNGYAFFFESLFILSRNGYQIAEMPNILSPRTYGHSKMTLNEILRSVKQLLFLFGRRFLRPKTVLIQSTES